MPVIRSLLTHFGFKIESGKLQGFQKQVAATKGRLRVAAQEGRRMQREMRGIGNMARYAVVAFIGSRFVKIFTTGYAKTLDEAMKFSRQIGLNVESLQALGYAALESGVGQKELQAGLLRFSRSLRDAQEGSKKVAKAFSDIGLSIRNLPLEDQEKTLKIVADRFAALPAGANKAALAQELFGRSGAKLIPLLDEGSVGMERLMRKARELGIVMSEKDAKAAEDFNNQLAASKAALLGLRNIIARQVLPHLTKLFRGFQRWIREGNNAKRLLEVLKKVAIVTGAILASIVTFKIIKLFQSFGLAIKSATRWLLAMGKAGIWARLKLFLMFALLLLIAAAIEDLHAFATGKKSLIGEWLGEDTAQAKLLKKTLLDFGAALKEAWKELKEPLMDLWGALLQLFSAIWKIVRPLLPWLLKGFILLVQIVTFMILSTIDGFKRLKEDLGALMTRIGEIADAVINWFVKAWNSVKNTAAGAVAFVVGIWKGGINSIKAAWMTIANAVGSVARAVENAWKNALDWVLKQIEWITEKVIGAAERLGIIKGGSLAKVGLGAFANIPTGRTSIQQNNRASVGSLNVTVSGTADMSAPEMQNAVKGGALDALNDLIKTNFADLRPVTT